MKLSRYNYLWFVVVAMWLVGCGQQQIERVEWPVMGTIAAVQTRGFTSSEKEALWVRGLGQPVFGIVELNLNAHDPNSELSRLAPCSDEKVCASCNSDMRPCYEAAFALQKASDGAFNPRWRGTNTLDLGAIAKGFAVDRLESTLKTAHPVRTDCLIDLGGNLKALRGNWRTGVKDPDRDGFAAVVDLHEGEALATSATYYRGSHIYDGRTGLAVSNGVASVTVLCNSAMWADGLSTTLFVLGPEEGRKFLDDKLKLLVGDMEVSALWIMDGGRQEIYGNARFQGN
jgi:thiamine biosynthesis lipoprotein